MGCTSNSSPCYYADDIRAMTHVFYAFLTLDKTPNPDSPRVATWDGQGIYESMTQADVLEVMKKTDPAWQNNYNWQRVKIVALMDACRQNGTKFIWSIGGWSDLTETLRDDQIDAFVGKVVALLKVGGDGVDFDWEHLSQDAALKIQQTEALATVMTRLRQ